MINVGTFEDLINCIQDVDEGDTLFLTSDIDLSSRVTFKGKFTLDLGKHVVTSSKDSIFYFPKGCDVLIKNGVINTTCTDFITTLGTQALPSKVTLGNDLTITSNSSLLCIQKHSKCVI